MATYSSMPVPGKSHEQRTLAGYSPWDHKQSDTTEQLINNNSLSVSLDWILEFSQWTELQKRTEKWMQLLRSACWAVHVKSVLGRKGRTRRLFQEQTNESTIWESLGKLGDTVGMQGVTTAVCTEMERWPTLCSGMGMPGQAGHTSEWPIIVRISWEFLISLALQRNLRATAWLSSPNTLSIPYSSPVPHPDPVSRRQSTSQVSKHITRLCALEPAHMV